jgi:dolichyl-phosphate-mannose-protein mannosyltransferase
VVLAFGYIARTPPWQNPDEPAHYSYIAFVSSTGGLPVLQDGDWDSAVLERVKHGTASDSEISSIRYESWQPPLFYLLAAPVFRLSNGSLWALRALDAVFGALTLILAFSIARTVLPPALAATVPLAIVGIPMFTAVSSSLSADPLANLLAAAILLTLVTRPGWVFVGILLGLGLLTKLELVIFVPLIAIVLRRVRAFGIAAVMLVPWLIHQVTSYGWADPLAIARHSQVVADQPRFPGFSLDWLGQFLTISFHSFWAQFGWMAVVAPDRLYWLWGIVTAAGVVGVLLDRAWLRDHTWQLLVATALVAFVAYVGYNLTFEQFQSRYLFTAIVPIAALLVLGWSRLRYGWVAIAIAGGLVAVNAYALVRVLQPGFAPV